MYNLSREERQLFRDVKEMFPDVSSVAIKRNLHKGRQELTEMILDGELPSGDQYRDEEEEDPPHYAVLRRKGREDEMRAEWKREDDARPPKQLRWADEKEEKEENEEGPMFAVPLRQRLLQHEQQRQQQLRRAAAAAAAAAGDDLYDEEDEEPMGRRRSVAAAVAAAATAADDDIFDEEDTEPVLMGARRQVTAAVAAAAVAADDDIFDEEDEEPIGRRRSVAAAVAAAALAADDDLYDEEDEEPVGRRRSVAAAVAAAAAAADSEEDDDETVVMRPLKTGERCSGHPKRPLVAWVECGKAPKPHLICLDCLMIRHADGRLKALSRDEYTCPIRGCPSRIATRALHGALRAHARPFLAQLREQMRQLQPVQLQPKLKLQPIDEEGGEEDTILAQPPPLSQLSPIRSTRRLSQLLQATTPLGRRLSQGSDPGSPLAHSTPRPPQAPTKKWARPMVWTPATSSMSTGSDATRRDAFDASFPSISIDDEELPVTEEEAEDLRMMAAFVDREKLKKLQSHFPETAVGWLVRHADYGMEALVEMVVKGGADPKMRERADGRGATTVIKQTLADRKQFECSVCFDDFDEHLAIKCVYLAKQRADVEVEQTEEERAREEEEEEKSRKDEHKFCADCIIGHARAALEQQVIMAGGVGIKCMQPRCTRALLRAHIEQVLDMQTRAVLDPLFSSEALLAADCDDVEKCQRCSYAAVIEAPKEQHPVFQCGSSSCGHAHCRKCGRPWDNVHKNRTCEELDPESVRRRVEEELTMKNLHQCPRCKKGIVKADGCNKISCPCGQKSCYVCKAAIKDYKHFKNGPADEHSTKCPLWLDPTAEFEKARLAELQAQINGAADDKIREELRRLQ